MNSIPTFVVQTLREKREELVVERTAATAEIDRKIAEIDSVLVGANGASAIVDVKPAVAATAAAFNTASMVAAAEALLEAGVPATTSAIVEALARTGMEMPQDAAFRVTKALSRTGRYKGGRVSGWKRI